MPRARHSLVTSIKFSIFSVGPTTCQQLLNWMLAIACQQGHLDIVKLLIRAYSADPESCAVRKNEFPVLIRLPLYAAIKAGMYLHASKLLPFPATVFKGWVELFPSVEVSLWTGLPGIVLDFRNNYFQIKLALNLVTSPNLSQGLSK